METLQTKRSALPRMQWTIELYLDHEDDPDNKEHVGTLLYTDAFAARDPREIGRLIASYIFEQGVHRVAKQKSQRRASKPRR